jgi:hypothetical protein
MDSLNMFVFLNEMNFLNPGLQSTFVPVIPASNSN